MAWFDFAALCEGPRGASDYIEIASEFHTVLLGGVPVFDAQHDDAARRFVTLIDELYDRHVNFICTAAAEPTALYRGERLSAAFERAASRLIEMRSAEYLALRALDLTRGPAAQTSPRRSRAQKKARAARACGKRWRRRGVSTGPVRVSLPVDARALPRRCHHAPACFSLRRRHSA